MIRGAEPGPGEAIRIDQTLLYEHVALLGINVAGPTMMACCPLHNRSGEPLLPIVRVKDRDAVLMRLPGYKQIRREGKTALHRIAAPKSILHAMSAISLPCKSHYQTHSPDRRPVSRYPQTSKRLKSLSFSFNASCSLPSILAHMASATLSLAQVLSCEFSRFFVMSRKLSSCEDWTAR